MRVVNFEEGMRTNVVGCRYLKDNRYVDVTDNYFSFDYLDSNEDPTDFENFGLGTECREEEAYDFLNK